MNRTLFRTLTWVMWLALPAMALRFWRAWDRLPARMATHFDANWRPNGWMPRETAFLFSLSIIALMLLVFTVILLLMQRPGNPPPLKWVMLIFSYFIVGFVYYGNDKVVSYNLTGQPIHMFFPAILAPLAVIAFMAFYLKSTRGTALPPSVPLAEEVHGSPLWGAVLVAAGVGAAAAALQAPAVGVRIAAGLILLLLLVCGFAAWSGFHYSFTPYGFEISTLGFRLRSVPKEQIERYAIEPWNFFRGYGIRGVGNLRAYVWGNHGVQVDTTQGKVYLGHSDPGQIVRDLQMIAPRGQQILQK